jgi:hypothetical protein
MDKAATPTHSQPAKSDNTTSSGGENQTPATTRLIDDIVDMLDRKRPPSVYDYHGHEGGQHEDEDGQLTEGAGAAAKATDDGVRKAKKAKGASASAATAAAVAETAGGAAQLPPAPEVIARWISKVQVLVNKELGEDTMDISHLVSAQSMCGARNKPVPVYYVSRTLEDDVQTAADTKRCASSVKAAAAIVEMVVERQREEQILMLQAINKSLPFLCVTYLDAAHARRSAAAASSDVPVAAFRDVVDKLECVLQEPKLLPLALRQWASDGTSSPEAVLAAICKRGEDEAPTLHRIVAKHLLKAYKMKAQAEAEE